MGWFQHCGVYGRMRGKLFWDTEDILRLFLPVITQLFLKVYS